jgi:acetyl-CoA carboxylase carboxyltransferase component
MKQAGGIAADKIENLIPKDSKIPIDARDIIRSLVDDYDFFEVQELAPNAISGFSRINGETVRIFWKLRMNHSPPNAV